MSLDDKTEPEPLYLDYDELCEPSGIYDPWQDDFLSRDNEDELYKRNPKI
jgi:hypothetical protein